MDNFRADFYKAYGAVENMDFDEICEYVYSDGTGHEGFNGELVIGNIQGGEESKAIFRFSPEFEGYDDENQPVGEQLGWIYRGCFFEEITRTKYFETEYNE
jgi:hypothetical protein